MADVTLTVVQQFPEDNGNITFSSGGAWANLTVSIKVLAYYKGDTTLIDNYGVDRTTVAAWNNLNGVPGVPLNNIVTIPVLFDTTRAFTFVIIGQFLSTFDESAGGQFVIDDSEITITQITATTWSIDVNSEASSRNLTVQEDPNILEFSPPIHTKVQYRPTTTNSYKGSGIEISYLDDRIIESASIIGNNTVSDDDTTMQTIQRWMRDRVRIMVETDATSYYNWIKGFIQNYTEYTSRITTDNFTILLNIDAEDV